MAHQAALLHEPGVGKERALNQERRDPTGRTEIVGDPEMGAKRVPREKKIRRKRVEYVLRDRCEDGEIPSPRKRTRILFCKKLQKKRKMMRR